MQYQAGQIHQENATLFHAAQQKEFPIRGKCQTTDGSARIDLLQSGSILIDHVSIRVGWILNSKDGEGQAGSIRRPGNRGNRPLETCQDPQPRAIRCNGAQGVTLAGFVVIVNVAGLTVML